MGLDLSINRMDKAYFDANCNEARILDRANKADARLVELNYYRKHHDILSLLSEVCGDYDSSVHFELTRLRLKKARRQAVRDKYLRREEMKVLVKALDRILHQTDFQQHTITFDWVP